MLKCAIFIDGPYFRLLQQRLGWSVDFDKFKQLLVGNRLVVHSYYYFGYAEEKHHKMLQNLSRAGYTVRCIKMGVVDALSSIGKKRGGVLVPLVIDVMEAAPVIDVAVFCAGNKELAPLLEHLRDKKISIELVSSGEGAADGMKSYCSKFTDVGNCRRQLEYAGLEPEVT
jgi:uncharacterized LabA/DUF88 family protein